MEDASGTRFSRSVVGKFLEHRYRGLISKGLLDAFIYKNVKLKESTTRQLPSG
uniref:Uncharacterized protein n=1 Tax=Utricularia reniformis TaxID=192314 RepID=A0A1Y0AZ93_9LAMI|nr:hypothetical protein AEK19_MT0225 [Utricularia reniformis]ART30502.1 hypothetical protein AEK19_MT0225 [Utricularia reniformis]